MRKPKAKCSNDGAYPELGPNPQCSKNLTVGNWTGDWQEPTRSRVLSTRSAIEHFEGALYSALIGKRQMVSSICYTVARSRLTCLSRSSTDFQSMLEKKASMYFGRSAGL